MVKSVEYDKQKNHFVVRVKDLKNDLDFEPEVFSHVIVASGHFSVPNLPSVEGLETFEGRVLHSHDFRDARDFKGKKILVVGSSYSAEDMALQCNKFGAGHIITCYRTRPMDFKWPSGIEERQMVEKLEKNTAYFKDGTKADIDVIIFATGYLYTFPFMPDELRLKTKLTCFPENLYKGTLWTKGGNNKLFYMGMHDQYYSYTMFDVQAEWTVQIITGVKKLPNEAEMIKDAQKWRSDCVKNSGCYHDIAFQTEYVEDLRKEVGRTKSLNVKEMFDKWEADKRSDIATYRDQQFKSIFTGETGQMKNNSTWMQSMDDSLDYFMN